jgi:low temperature requirement protein LtrA
VATADASAGQQEPITTPPREEPAGAERRTTPIELLWDLVFAFAVTRVTTLLLSDLSWRGLGHALLTLALVWWAWSAFVWVTNAHDPDSAAFRAVLLVATALIFLAGLALPHAFGSDATLFAATYAGVRLLHLGLYVDASRRGHASLAAIAGFVLTTMIGLALLLAGSFAGEVVRVALWVAAAAIDYAGPAWLTRKRLRSLQEVAVAHFAERYSLFIIICLGESIVAIGVGASSRPLTAASVGAVFLALLVTTGLWWTYFDRFATEAEERLRRHADPVITAADAYSYIHLVLVAGIIIFAVGARTTAAHAGAALTSAERLTLCCGVAIYLVGHVAFRLRMAGRLHRPELAAAAACLIVFAAAGGLTAWAVVGLIMLVLALLVTWDSVMDRRRPRAR